MKYSPPNNNLEEMLELYRMEKKLTQKSLNKSMLLSSIINDNDSK